MNNEQSADKKQSFWSTLPGILTTLSGLVVAITGLVTVFINLDAQGSADIPPTRVEQTTAPTQAVVLPEPTVTDAPEESPTPTLEIIQPTTPPTPTTALVVHSIIPEEPGNISWYLDSSSLLYANEGRATADDFLNMPFERPFTSQGMSYVGYVDINRVEISSQKTFIYVSIGVEETPPQGAEVYYGVELDVDMDGRGDWLIYGLVPPDSEWTVSGVQVYEDSDDNVGGPSPITSNNGISSNGYETRLFDSGVGANDPDLAWIRRSPEKGNHIQIAFKLSLIDNAKRFLWSAWTDAGPREPAWFDYNDYFTLEQAGSPILDANEYPLNGLALVDNTCRWPYGFKASGDEPGICP
ncbi:MAG: hypothetical protein JW757_04280 [Anaerolineales bacterium]|nr:hypothetical protein [Anaerolineales bacterium]